MECVFHAKDNVHLMFTNDDMTIYNRFILCTILTTY